MVIESFVTGWRDALSATNMLEKLIATDTLPPCALCTGKSGRRYRFPALRGPSSSKVVRALQDPTGRAGSLAVLDGILGDLDTTMLPVSHLPDGPTEIRGGGYGEIDHPVSENGQARFADTVPTRPAGLGSSPPPRRCTDSICFCPGMMNCPAEPRAQEDSRSLSRADLADRRHEEQAKGETGPFFRGPEGTGHQGGAVGNTRSPSPDRSISLWIMSTYSEDSRGNQQPSALPGKLPREVARAGALAGPEEELPGLEDEYNPRKPRKSDTRYDPRNPDEILLLVSDTSLLQWLGTNLVTRARHLTAQLNAHRVMGAELEWDYDSDKWRFGPPDRQAGL